MRTDTASADLTPERPVPQGPLRPRQASILRSARAKASMTQDLLAGAAGVSVRTVIRAERGSEIGAENLRAICAALEIDVRSLSDPSEDALAPAETPSAPTEADPPARYRPFPVPVRLLALSALLLVLVAAGNLGMGAMWSQTDWRGEMRSRSVHQGTYVVGHLNAAMRALSAGERNPFPLGSLTYRRTDCRMTEPVSWALGRYATCEDVTVRFDPRRRDDRGLAFSIGPVDASFLEAFALQLRDDRGTRVRMALTPDGLTPRPGTLWFDPRGVDPRLLPAIDPSRSFLQVELAVAEDAR